MAKRGADRATGAGGAGRKLRSAALGLAAVGVAAVVTWTWEDPSAAPRTLPKPDEGRRDEEPLALDGPRAHEAPEADEHESPDAGGWVFNTEAFEALSSPVQPRTWGVPADEATTVEAPAVEVPVQEVPVQEAPVRVGPEVDDEQDEDPRVGGWVFAEPPDEIPVVEGRVAERPVEHRVVEGPAAEPSLADDTAIGGWIFATPPEPAASWASTVEESDDEFPVVEAPRIGRRRRETERARGRRVIQVGLFLVVLAICAALPWIVPAVPKLFADAVPAPAASPTAIDPSVAPPTTAPLVSATPGSALVGKVLASAGQPLEVTVPRLHITSNVVPISGQTGELIPPSDPQLLGWWQEGPLAGEAQGSSVVTGHTVSVGGGAFDHLGELVPGDRLRLRTAAGWITYMVTESLTLSVKQLARTAKQIFNLSGQGRLVLITCTDFNGTIYLSNSVVYATPVKDVPLVGTGVGAPRHRTHNVLLQKAAEFGISH